MIRIVMWLLLWVCTLISHPMSGGVPPDEKIDLVYTWVDDSDIEWQVLHDRLSRTWRPLIGENDANHSNRFRNRDELKYSLRSVLQFAPFINHIYIVTAKQVPSWLKPHPRITIIDHSEIFLSDDDLPTFNSQAIEANLHRIPLLSEHYLYLNDDMFFGSMVRREDFFSEDGKIKVFCSTRESPRGRVMPGEITYRSAWKNTNRALDAAFQKDPRYHLVHAPYAMRKSLAHEVEKWFPHIFRLVSSHTFRQPTDYTITNGLIQYYGLYTDKAVRGKISSKTVWLGRDYAYNVRQLFALVKGGYKTFCLEDVEDSPDPALDIVLQQFFETYFPKPAPWEKKSPASESLELIGYTQGN